MRSPFYQGTILVLIFISMSFFFLTKMNHGNLNIGISKCGNNHLGIETTTVKYSSGRLVETKETIDDIVFAKIDMGPQIGSGPFLYYRETNEGDLIKLPVSFVKLI